MTPSRPRGYGDVSEEGSATADRTCAACAGTTFSVDANQPACTPWTDCVPGDEESIAGTATTDRTCCPTEWVTQFGTTLTTSAKAVAARSDGSLAVAGITYGTLPGQVGVGMIDAYVQIFDGGGVTVWTRQFGTSAEDTAAAITVANNGDVIIVGDTTGVLPGQVSAGFRDAFVRVYDAAGTLQWTRQFGSSNSDTANAVSVGADGTIVVAGTTNAALAGQTFAGVSDAFVAAFDASGNALWVRQFGSSTTDQAFAVSVGNGGVIAVAGDTFGTLPGQQATGSHSAFVRLYEADGDVLWTRQFNATVGSLIGAEANAVSVGGNGQIVVAGTVIGALTDQVSAGNSDTFVQVFATSGAVVWTRQLGSSASDNTTAVNIDGRGNIAVSGTTSGTMPGQTSLGGLPDAFAQTYSVSGSPLWTRQFGTSSADTAYGAAFDARGNLAVVGYTRGKFPGQTQRSDYDAYVLRVIATP